MSRLVDGIVELFMGLVCTVIIGVFIVSLYPTYVTYYGNSQVFLVGALVMILIGLLPLFYLFYVLQNVAKTIQKGDKPEPPSFGGGGFQ